ncbi:MAG: serine hydrolase, partial [Phycisphaerales bacterium]|nr:serine hydrolase [Phycisphaerales bacterium]
KDEVIYAKGFGRRNVEEDLPVTSRTLFAIGSSSKAFTTFTLATLVEEGRLDWDEPVQTYLPDFRLHDEYASTHVTTRDMVSHRTGLPRHDLMWYNNTKVDRAELVRRLRYLEPNKGLREAWQYNNLMFLTAGSLAGALHGGTWEDAVRARVLEPLGMHDVTFSVVESQKTSDYAMPYTVHEEAIERMAFRDISLIGPAGSINAGVDDMCKWLRVHLDQGRVGDRELVGAAGMSDMHSVQMAMGGIPTDAEIVTVGYGMGWMIDVYHGHYRVHHGGNIDGFSALVSLLPRDRLGVVVLTNMNATGLTELVVREVTDRVLDLEDRDWFGEAAMQREQMLAAGKAAEETKQDPRVAGTTLNHPLEAYAGRYEHPGYGIVTFSTDGDHLAVEYNDITAPLEHWHYEVFSGLENPDDRTFNDMKFSFNHDIQGHLVSVSMQFDPFVDPIVFTRLADARLTDPAYLDHFVGRFSIAGQPLRIFRRANALWAQSPGQPASELVAAGDDRFIVKEATMISFAFRLDEAGVPVMKIVLPNGIFDLVPAASNAK